MGWVAVADPAVGSRKGGVDACRRDGCGSDALGAELAVEGVAEIDLGALVAA
jgi:hypothetical protein